jgi:hypothetical protein
MRSKLKLSISQKEAVFRDSKPCCANVFGVVGRDEVYEWEARGTC